MPTLNVCVEIYMNKKSTKVIHKSYSCNLNKFCVFFICIYIFMYSYMYVYMWLYGYIYGESVEDL